MDNPKTKYQQKYPNLSSVVFIFIGTILLHESIKNHDETVADFYSLHGILYKWLQEGYI